MQLGNVTAVFLFEWRRALTGPRIAWWLALTLFPAAIALLIQWAISDSEDASRRVWAVFLFALSPMLICMLGTFLWTTPAVSAELERKSWAYLAVRPNGGTAVLLGKYLAAIVWVLPAALIGMTLALIVSQSDKSWITWLALARLFCLSCPAYAAVYLLIGTLFPKRSMLIAIAYTLIFELIISFVPALINELTVQFRLRALLLDWAEFPVQRATNIQEVALLNDAPAWWNVTVLLLSTAAMVIAAVVAVRRCEFSVAEEADV